MSYNITFEDIRATSQGGKKYAKVRAIANGTDSYKSIFSKGARDSFIKQLKLNGVQVGAQHRNAILRNVQKYMQDRYSKSYGGEKLDLEELLGSLPNYDFPIGIVEDAYFVDDNVVEAVIRENSDLRLLGKEQSDYLDGSWSMIESGALSGVSMVFQDVKTMQEGNNIIIDDLQVTGLDFVDRPAHKDTRVVDTFMRAIQDNGYQQETKMTNEEPNKQEATPQPTVVNVDEIVAKAEAKFEEKQRQKEALESEQNSLKSEYETKLAEKEKALEELNKDKEEALKLAEDALKTAEQSSAKIDNPFAQRAQAEVEKNDPYKDLSFKELIQLKLQNNK